MKELGEPINDASDDEIVRATLTLARRQGRDINLRIDG